LVLNNAGVNIEDYRNGEKGRGNSDASMASKLHNKARLLEPLSAHTKVFERK